MTVINPSTDIGKLRLRVGDVLDLPIMPDVVYQSALDECDDNLPRAAVLMAQYILGTLTAKTHRKLGQIEVWGSSYFDQYVEFIKLTILNPHLMTVAPIPYGADSDVTHPLLQFQEDWNNNWSSGTQSAQMNVTAIGGVPSDRSFGF